MNAIGTVRHRPARTLSWVLDRTEAYLSLLFSGVRLAVFAILALLPLSDTHPRHDWLLAGIAGSILLVTAEVLLIRAIGRAARSSVPRVAPEVAEQMRHWPRVLRVPLALAYAVSAAGSWGLCLAAESAAGGTPGGSPWAAAAVGFVVVLAASYTVNLALTASMAAAGLSRGLVGLVHRNRLLIDAVVATAVALWALPR